MEPSSFKFDEEDCRGEEVAVEGEQQQQQLDDNFSENDTFDDDDHYFRMPSSTTATTTSISDKNSNTSAGRDISFGNFDTTHEKNESIKTLNDAPTSSSAHTIANTNNLASSSSQLPPRSSNSMNAPPPPPPTTQPPQPRRPNRNMSNNSRSTSSSIRNTQQKQQKSNQQHKKSNQRTASSSNEKNDQTNTNNNNNKPTLEPYLARLEKFELFSTLQCYYLVACDKHSTEYRIMKMDRTLIEKSLNAGGGEGREGREGREGGSSVRDNISKNNAGNRGEGVVTGIEARNSIREKKQQQEQQFAEIPLERQSVHLNANSFDNTTKKDDDDASTNNTKASSFDQLDKDDTKTTLDDEKSSFDSPSSPSKSSTTNTNTSNHQQQNQNQSTQQNQRSSSQFRQLSDFIFEDPAIYTQSEIRDILDMINDGNKKFQGSGSGSGISSRDVPLSSTDSKEYDDRTGGANSGSGSGNSNGGTGLKPICKAYGILGFIKFLDCYYLTLITKRAKVGNIGGNSIYTIKQTETFPLKPVERTKSGAAGQSGNTSLSEATNPSYNDPSSMLLSMWNRGKRSVGLGLSNREIAELRYQGLYQVVDLTKNFFFSYTYDLTRSLQENFLGMTSRSFPPPPFKDMYAWNFFLTRELEQCTHSVTSFHWVLPVVHGAFIQRKLHDYGRSLNLMLLARRSRHFAGTRYLKRGVSDRGKVANDVEHEQIIHDESASSEGVFSSYLQIRGSIPTFWTQESSVTMPKPPIVLNRVDPTYQATQAHFEDLLKRYGSPIIVVDLVKQSEKREREVIVGNEFRNAIDYINCHIDDDHKILYCALDYSHISKHRNLNVSSSLNDVATWSVNQTGFFCSNPQWKIMEGGRIEPFDDKDNKEGSNNSTEEARRLSQRLGGILFFPMEQMGILRTNCIDCLDRTNVAQFSAGVEALGQQLVVMGIRSSPKLDPSSIIVRMLIDMYVEIGDQIALQYGGSEAHKKVQSSAGEKSNIPGQLGKHKELLTSIRRYYSNAFTDRLKQDAMNLFLGYYIPSNNNTPLWELDNDYYLHNFHVNSGRGDLQSMKAYQSMFGVLEWNDLEDESNQQRLHKPGSSLALADDQARIDRVKQRCSAQNSALSVWWKVAIQAYIQQRMWMTLGGNPSGSSLPLRFDRLYRPQELSHFDKVFARPWATPSRLSHEDQHKSAIDDEGIAGLNHRKAHSAKESKITLFDERVQSISKTQEKKASTEEEDKDSSYISLQDYVSTHGFASKSRSSLNQLTEAHAYKPHALSSSEEKPMTWKGDNTLHYLGSLKGKHVPNSKNIDYASSSIMPKKSFHPGRREEFVKSLNNVGVSIDSNDVDGIRKLAESAHIGQEIQSGPYRGLNQNESSVRVATTIHAYYNYLEEKVEEGELSYDEIHPPELLETLKQRDMYSVGVTETFYDGWKHIAKAEKSYNEIIDMSSIGYRRSDITTDSSMKLYSSFFDQSSEINQLEQAYALGERLPSDPSKPLRRSTRPCDKVSGTDKDLRSFDEASFILKAASKGVNVKKKSSSKGGSDKDMNMLESLHTQKPIPGFEQINEDLFARKDNKFMVFNSAGVDSWNAPPEPVTKTRSGIDILATLK